MKAGLPRAILMLGAIAGQASAEPDPDPLTAPGLVQEVVSTSENPHAHDWRRASVELRTGFGYIDEANNFDNEVYELGLGFPSADGMIPWAVMRRVNVYATPASHQIQRTPFRQDAGMTRYEIGGGVDYSLLEGRSMSRLSPTTADLGHALFGTAGLHFSHPNASWIPKRKDTPKPLPGQDPVNSLVVAELGVRWHVYLPQSFGIYTQANLNLALRGDANLGHWAYFAGGLLYDFGVK